MNTEYSSNVLEIHVDTLSKLQTEIETLQVEYTFEKIENEQWRSLARRHGFTSPQALDAFLSGFKG